MTTTPRGTDALVAARALHATIAPRADEIERARAVPRDLVDALARAGIFRLTVPAVYGGDEAAALDVLRVVEELAFADGAVGWCAMIYLTTALNAASLAPAWADRIYRRADGRAPIVAGSTTPVGSATRVAGGMEVSGTWPWGSGAHHCDWIVGTAMVAGDAAGPPHPVVFYFPRADVELLDDWDPIGLCGTGSGSFRVAPVLVPEGRWSPLGGAAPHVDTPLYRFPFFGLFAAAIASVPLGIARRSVATFLALARRKIPTWARKTIDESSIVQLELGRAEALVSAARYQLFAIVDELWEKVARGDAVTLEDRCRVRLAACHATTASARAVARLYEAGGGTSVHRSCDLQRHLRDVETVTQHRMVSAQAVQLAGAVRLRGTHPDDVFL